jgi:hypothetical protein
MSCERDRGTERPTTADVAPAVICPACGGDTIRIKCKTVCARCRSLIENCSGD